MTLVKLICTYVAWGASCFALGWSIASYQEIKRWKEFMEDLEESNR